MTVKTENRKLKTALEIMMRFKFLLKHGHSIISVKKPLDIIALFGFNFPHAVEAIVSKQSFVINNKWATK